MLTSAIVALAMGTVLVPAALAVTSTVTTAPPAGAAYQDGGMIGFGDVSQTDPQMPEPLEFAGVFRRGDT